MDQSQKTSLQPLTQWTVTDLTMIDLAMPLLWWLSKHLLALDPQVKFNSKFFYMFSQFLITYWFECNYLFANEEISLNDFICWYWIFFTNLFHFLYVVFIELIKLAFVWGNVNLNEVKQSITEICEECVYWRRNLFLLPSGIAGKQFIEECTRLINDWANNAPLKPIALKALMIMPSLLLQKVSKTSKAKDHSGQLKETVRHVERRVFDKLTW